MPRGTPRTPPDELSPVVSFRPSRRTFRTEVSSLGPALEFLRTLWQVNHALERLSSRMRRELGVTAQQRLVLKVVGRAPGLTPSELAEVLHLDPGTVSSALRRLERKTLLARRPDLADRRRATLSLTKGGRTLDRPTSVTVEAAVKELFRHTSERDRTTTRRVLEKLTRALEGIAPSRDAVGARAQSFRVTKRVPPA